MAENQTGLRFENMFWQSIYFQNRNVSFQSSFPLASDIFLSTSVSNLEIVGMPALKNSVLRIPQKFLLFSFFFWAEKKFFRIGRPFAKIYRTVENLNNLFIICKQICFIDSSFSIFFFFLSKVAIFQCLLMLMSFWYFFFFPFCFFFFATLLSAFYTFPQILSFLYFSFRIFFSVLFIHASLLSSRLLSIF